MTISHSKFRNKLKADLVKIEEALIQSATSTGTVTLDQSSVGRLSRMDAMQQQAMAQNMQGRLLLQKRKLMAALDRLEAGTFGICCQCSSVIGQERLDNDSATVFCADCMAEREAEHDNH